MSKTFTPIPPSAPITVFLQPESGDPQVRNLYLSGVKEPAFFPRLVQNHAHPATVGSNFPETKPCIISRRGTKRALPVSASRKTKDRDIESEKLSKGEKKQT